MNFVDEEAVAVEMEVWSCAAAYSKLRDSFRLRTWQLADTLQHFLQSEDNFCSSFNNTLLPSDDTIHRAS